MNRITTKIRRISKKYSMVFIILILVCICLGISYASFIFTSSDYRASQMIISSLKYQISVDDVVTNTISVSPGEKTYSFTITSNNEVATYYKLAYQTNDNISVQYGSLGSNTVGQINVGESKEMNIIITNTSSSSIDVNFNVYGGFINNTLDDVIIASGYAQISASSDKWYYNCYSDDTDIRCVMLSKGNFADNVASTYVTSATGINFAAISSDTNGKGLYFITNTSLTTGGERVYYYRGAVDNNYLVFGNYCYRIVRTNEDGSVKVRYDGEYANSVCTQTGTDVNIGTSNFNSSKSYNACMGYMYGTQNSSTYAAEHANTNNSLLKTSIDSWYSTNIASNTSLSALVADTIYCNDRSIATRTTIGGKTNSKLGYAQNQTMYGATDRLVADGSWIPKPDAQPSYICAQTNDQFTLSASNGGTSGYGNNMLTYPAALLTADEASFAGAIRYNSSDSATHNTTFFLYTSAWNWTMTPAYFAKGSFSFTTYGDQFQIRDNGSLDFDIFYGVSGAVMPAISLKSIAEISSGTGLYNDPYVVKIN